MKHPNTRKWKVIVRRVEEREFEVTANISDRDLLVHGALVTERNGEQINLIRSEIAAWEIVGVEGFYTEAEGGA